MAKKFKSFEQFKNENMDLYDQIGCENNWHCDDDFEKIEMEMYENHYINLYGEDPNF